MTVVIICFIVNLMLIIFLYKIIYIFVDLVKFKMN
jgi:hypothetical protein